MFNDYLERSVCVASSTEILSSYRLVNSFNNHNVFAFITFNPTGKLGSRESVLGSLPSNLFLNTMSLIVSVSSVV